MRTRAGSINNSGMPNNTMRRTTKALVATAALAVGIAAAVIVPKAYTWSRHKEDVVVVRKQEKKEPPLQAVPVRADAGMEKPMAMPEKKEERLRPTEEEARKAGYGLGRGLPYKKTEAEKRLEALEQTP